MIDIPRLAGLTIPEGKVVMFQVDGVTMWDNRIGYRYVSMGDSIAGGHAIDSDWEHDYGEETQYGVNGNTSTAIVQGCYTHLIGQKLQTEHKNIKLDGFARSGDTVADLMEKLNHEVVRDAVSKAELVTVCIGANDVLEPSLMHLEEYIATGDLSTIEATIETNLTRLNTDSNAGSYKALLDKLNSINPSAQYVFMTIYNPYRYLWIDEGQNGFFKPLLDSIPQMTILGFELDELIKDGLLRTSAVKRLYSRVNGLDDWAERYVVRLNNIIVSKVSARSNMSVTDAKTLFEAFPDRGVTAEHHYNDLVNVEFTRGFNVSTMDWGQLFDGDIEGFWLNLASKYTSSSGFDIEGFASELVALVIERVVVPDIDPHPEPYGHYVLMRGFSDALGWSSLERYKVTFNGGGASGSMPEKTVLGVDGLPVYFRLPTAGFSVPAGYYFKGWSTAPNAGGTMYSAGDSVPVTGNLALYAVWSNEYTLTYRHLNKTELYGNDETGHMECYALYIDGQEMPDLGKFSDNLAPVYTVPYGATIKVVVSHYKPNDILYKSADCHVYMNGSQVASGTGGTEYSFTLTSNATVDFWWEIAGSLVSANAKSWEDCYITM